MRTVRIGSVQVSRLCIGGNPFSGFSHQGSARSAEMREYFTPERIRQTLREAEAAGINTFFGRTDDHIFGVVREHWREGGKIQWFAQACDDKDKARTWKDWIRAVAGLGASGAYLHGGLVDSAWANGQFDTLREGLDLMRGLGLAAGFAGHRPEAHEWIRDNLDPDFQMCSWYNPTDRSKNPEHQSEGERWRDEDRERMIETISTIGAPVVHYKVFAAANKPVLPAFDRMAVAMRPGDVACVGMFTKDDPGMVANDVALFDERVG